MFKLSLAQWSFHKALQSGKMTNLDFPIVASRDFGFNAIEYVNQFFMDKALDKTYLQQLKTRCDDHGVKSLLIMVDHEGMLADPDSVNRTIAVQNHHKWIEAAHFLGCHSIRVNCFGSGTAEEMSDRCLDSLSQLCDFAAPAGINILVENHGGYSSNAKWLVNVVKSVGRKNCGTLPDFGNFCTKREKGDMWESPCLEWYDRYEGMKELLPYAKGMSAKSMRFDSKGNCVETDYKRMLTIIREGGYTGHIGVEYEGSDVEEAEGVRLTKALIDRMAI